MRAPLVYRRSPPAVPPAAVPEWKAAGRQAELRLLTACDQRCFFCNCGESVPNLAPPGTKAAARAIVVLRRAGAETLVLTGGEPTLREDLTRLTALAKRAGFRAVLLQTNAMRLGEDGLARRLRRAGLDGVFASLHATSPGLSDRLTGEPGGFARTARGLEAAAAAGLRVTVNAVATALNLGEFPRLVGWTAARLGRSLDGLALSFMAPVAAGAANLDAMPRLRDAAAAFRIPLKEGRRRGLRVRVSGVCGVPLCQLAGFEAESDELRNAPGRPPAADRRFGAACGPCSFRDRCSGFWRLYLDRYGDGELVPASTLRQKANPR